jgi:ribonuclease R
MKTGKKKEKHSDHKLVLKGKLEITRSGVGFVVHKDAGQDILVRPNDFHSALHGDTVRVKITSRYSQTGRMQGEVLEVLERKQKEFLGHIEMRASSAIFIPETEKPMPDILIPAEKLAGAVDHERVIVRLTGWEEGKMPAGEVVQILDSRDENDRIMKEILLESGFPISFPEEVLEEAARLPDTISSGEIAGRRDLRGILTLTIDPADARDFDDALSFKVLGEDIYEIGVHIADVGHYVGPETALDKEAYTRATSVYLPDRVNPMLPEAISNELCSLRPHEDKLCFSVIFQIGLKGQVRQFWIGKTVTHSDHRFSYEEAQESIEGKSGLYQSELTVLNESAQKLRRHRFKKGAINFSSVEVKFTLDDQGRPIGIQVKENTLSHQLIEEFMLLANKTVAEYVSKIKIDKLPVPFPYRIHDTPDKEKLLPFIEFAKKYGHRFETKTPKEIAASFNQMLQDVQGKPEQHVLEQLGIRTMSKAVYSTENIGHYGLGFEQYCHFTSPIRRFPDILVHRVLAECIAGDPKPDRKMESKCKHSSERERAAMESERAAHKYKQVEYMQEFLGEDFEGVISGVAAFGFWVETVLHKCEGLVSIHSLLDYDDFRLIEDQYCLSGRRSGRQFRMGDRIRIRVVAANLAKRQLDYEWVFGEAEGEEMREKKKREPLKIKLKKKKHR